MTRLDWLTASLVAVGVAAMTVTLTAPPICWAEQAALITVPALPSTQLTIPTIDAQVSASATPAPGQAVMVQLSLTSPSGSSVTQVPVTITVLRTDMNTMSRMGPRPQRLAQVEASIPVGIDGKGSAVAALPLTWATPAPPPAAVTTNAAPPAKQLPMRVVVTNYQMLLSSTLGGKAAPSDLQIISNIAGKQRVQFTAPPTQRPAPSAPEITAAQTANLFSLPDQISKLASVFTQEAHPDLSGQPVPGTLQTARQAAL